jgi:hypothetical protein
MYSKLCRVGITIPFGTDMFEAEPFDTKIPPLIVREGSQFRSLPSMPESRHSRIAIWSSYDDSRQIILLDENLQPLTRDFPCCLVCPFIKPIDEEEPPIVECFLHERPELRLIPFIQPLLAMSASLLELSSGNIVS